MKRTWKILGLFVAVFLLAVSIHVVRGAGQAAPVTSPSPASRDQKTLAVNIIRQINTAEVIDCRSKYGEIDKNKRFLSWDELLSAACFKQAQSRAGSSKITENTLSAGPEIVPGLELRLVVSSDGKHYNLWLGQNQAGNCGFAFYSDERGVIYEGRVIGCEAPEPAAPADDSRAVAATRAVGEFYLHRGEYDKAIASFQKALKLDPSNANLRYQLERAIRACNTYNKVSDEHQWCGEH
jgi:tetratricopeptide (TPR) repeat protein